MLHINFNFICDAYLEINPIDSGNGFISIENGNKSLISYYNTILHDINASYYNEELISIELAIPSNIDDSVINHKIKEIYDCLKFFNPRIKRGLFNFLGTIQSFLYGTMDASDKEEILNLIKSLEENNARVAYGINQQVKLNNHFNEEFKNISKIVNFNINNIKETISFQDSKINNLTEFLNNKIVKDAILDNLNLLLNHVSKLRNTLMMVKNNMIDMDILTDYELQQISLNQLSNIKTGIIKKNEIIYSDFFTNL